jgi:predicted nucleic acid-binding Zn ribbon protein
VVARPAPSEGGGGGAPEDRSDRSRAAAAPVDFTRLGDLVSGALPERARQDQGAGKRIAEVWAAAMGVEAARNSQPRHLRNGRLVVATSSSSWAQALQDQADRVVERLNGLLGEAAVDSILFRPAGWDPCAGREAPTPLEAAPGGWEGTEAAATRGSGGADAGAGPRETAAPRRLEADEVAAIEEVRRAAADPELGDRIAAAMRAMLEHRPPKE